jgi:hypothetical protein
MQVMTGMPVETDVLDRMAAATRHFGMGHTTDPARVQEMRDLSTEAIRIEFATERTLRESVELFRIGHREVNANPDGLEFTGPMFETLRLTGLFTREASMNPDGFVAASADAAFVETMQTAMGHIWQVTPGNTRLEQLRAGMDWVRINLAATEFGLGMQPLSQALQEYPEMSGLYFTMADPTTQPSATLAMALRPSGVEMPKPTITGRSVCALIRATSGPTSAACAARRR